MNAIDWKKLLLPNIPYLLFAYLFDKVGQAVRLAPGADLSGKVLSLGEGFSMAFATPLPSLAPMDLLIGIAGAALIRLIVYVKGKNAKKYRKGIEYGSARWGTAEDIKPYTDPVFQNNVLLTQTERLTMNSRPKQPKYATQVNYDNLFSGIVDYGDFLLLLPILVIIATSLFFTETDNDTLKNLTTIPISKSKIVVAKIGVMAIISVAYTLLGFFASVLCSKILGIAMENMAQKFVLSIGLGIMLLAAALPCVALVVWFNKSDLISIVITLFYTIINYVIHVTDIGMLTPVGVNIGTILPIPVINRWIYQFYDEGNGAAAEFYNTMRPYFVPTHICVCIIALFLFVSIYAIIKIYNRREI